MLQHPPQIDERDQQHGSGNQDHQLDHRQLPITVPTWLDEGGEAHFERSPPFVGAGHDRNDHLLIEVVIGKLRIPLTGVVADFDDQRTSRALHGLTRAIVANMVEGVTKGYEKRLEVVGVGYIAAVQGDTLQLRVGYANELHRKIPTGLNVTCPDQTHIVVQGCDKQMVGQFAAEIRALRKPEPYKGKGVRYQGEQVKIKPGKAATK